MCQGVIHPQPIWHAMVVPAIESEGGGFYIILHIWPKGTYHFILAPSTISGALVCAPRHAAFHPEDSPSCVLSLLPSDCVLLGLLILSWCPSCSAPRGSRSVAQLPCDQCIGARSKVPMTSSPPFQKLVAEG